MSNLHDPSPQVDAQPQFSAHSSASESVADLLTSLPRAGSIRSARFSFCFLTPLGADWLGETLCRSAGSPKSSGLVERAEYKSSKQ